MDGPDATRRENRASVTSRRAAIGRALRARDQGADNPDFVSLSDDEQSNGLATFSTEAARMAESTFERVAGRATTPVVTKQDIVAPVTPEVPSPVWLAPVLASGLAAAVVVFALLSVRAMRTTSDVPRMASITTASKGIEGARKASPIAHAAAPIAVPHGAPSPAPVAPAGEKPPAPTAVAKVPVSAPRESVRPPAPEPRRVRPDPPVHAAVVVSPPPAAAPRILEPPIAPPVDSPTVPAVLEAAPRPVAAVPASLPRAESTVAPVGPPAPEIAIQAVLSRYRSAYQGLDAAAAKAIWPTVDHKALARAFERLEQQRLVFETCQISAGDAYAMASCVGTASYVPRAGSKVRHDDQRQWDFTLSKADDGWRIDSVFAH